MFKKNKFINNISYVSIGKMLSALFAFLLDVFLARCLGINQYGEWLYFYTIQSFLFFIGWLGLDVAVRVNVSKCLSYEEVSQCTIGGLFARISYSLVVFGFAFFVMPILSYHLGYPIRYPNLARMLRISAFTVFFNSFSDYFKEWCVGTERFKELFLISVTEYIGYFLFSVLCYIFRLMIFAPVVGFLIAEIVTTVLGFYFLYKKGILVFTKNGKYCKYMNEIIKYALPLGATAFGGMLLIEMDTFMLGLMGNNNFVAKYGIAKTMSSKLTHINLAISTGTMSYFSVIRHSDYREKRGEFIRVIKMNASVSIGIAILVFAMGETVIRLFYGHEYIGSLGALRILMVYYLVYSLTMPYSYFIDYQGKALIKGLFFLGMALLNGILNYYWIPKFGEKGAALATSTSFLPYVFFAFIVSEKIWYKKKENNEIE